ncbi:MAG: PP2C family serine/threonine-protein phosphatase [Hyphomonadaceae bacterium]
MNIRPALPSTFERVRRPRAAHLGGLKYLSVSRSDEGRVRKLNEDAFLDRSDIGLWAVADGMGGHDSGEVASNLVVNALAGVEQFNSAYAYRDAVAAALQASNRALVNAAAERGGGVMGTTVAALLAFENHYACIWAGDSRVYLDRAGQIRRLTRDHSVVQELVSAGVLRKDEARRHAQAHVITRAVGAGATLELETVSGRIYPGDRFFLCSDGVTNLIEDDEIGEILARPPLQSAVDKIINLALARGAPDNVTAVLIGAEKA